MAQFYSDSSLSVAFFYHLSLVIFFPTFCESDRYLDEVSFKVNTSSNKCHTFLSYFLFQSEHDILSEKEFSSTFDTYICIFCKFIGTNMHTQNLGNTSTYSHMTPLQLSSHLTHAPNFPTKKLDSSFMLLDYFIIKECLFVVCYFRGFFRFIYHVLLYDGSSC